MLNLERRRRRGDSLVDALTFQLAACAEAEGLTALVLADGDGRRLAAWGDPRLCDAVGDGGDAEPIVFGSLALKLWAAGGEESSRRRSLERSASAVGRILSVWIAA